jgi:hypothetical protein
MIIKFLPKSTHCENKLISSFILNIFPPENFRTKILNVMDTMYITLINDILEFSNNDYKIFLSIL